MLIRLGTANVERERMVSKEETKKFSRSVADDC